MRLRNARMEVRRARRRLKNRQVELEEKMEELRESNEGEEAVEDKAGEGMLGREDWRMLRDLHEGKNWRDE